LRDKRFHSTNHVPEHLHLDNTSTIGKQYIVIV